MSSTDQTPVWFITGCSTGFGLELARLVLDRGWRAVVTARDVRRLDALAEKGGERALASALDVTRPEQVDASVRHALDRFGRVDVLVNNAGYGYQSSGSACSPSPVPCCRACGAADGGT